METIERRIVAPLTRFAMTTAMLFIFVVSSCKEDIYTTIPNAQVHLNLNLNSYDYHLKASLSYSIFTIGNYPEGRPSFALDKLGYGGLLIINGTGTETVNLYAYDLACPNEAARNVLVIPENTSETGAPTAITAKCPKCGAVYYILDGTGAPKSGSKYFLRAYPVAKTGNSGEYVVGAFQS